jgi:hypothetical protein
VGQFDAATLTASTGMDLGFDHPGSFTQSFGPFTGTGAVVTDMAVGNRNAELSQDRFCLVFVDVHVLSCTIFISLVNLVSGVISPKLVCNNPYTSFYNVVIQYWYYQLSFKYSIVNYFMEYTKKSFQRSIYDISVRKIKPDVSVGNNPLTARFFDV